MKRLGKLLNWKNMTVMGLAILAGGSLTAYEMKAAIKRADAASRTTSPARADAGVETEDESKAKGVTPPRRESTGEAQPVAATEIAKCSAALQIIHKKLSEMSDYSATFHMRERVGGKLLAQQQVGLRVRHKPFSVHMKWLDNGREVVFVKGRNNDNLIVKPGGLAALIGTLELDPAGATAMEEARYPITEMGMLALVEKLIAYQKPLIKDSTGATCQMLSVLCEGEDCDSYVLTYDDPSLCDGYAKTTLHISRQSGLLVSIENYGFDKSSKSGTSLIEHYVYTNVKPDTGFSDGDFTLARSGLTGRIRTAVAQRNVSQ
jgi:hypothetical protein